MEATPDPAGLCGVFAEIHVFDIYNQPPHTTRVSDPSTRLPNHSEFQKKTTIISTAGGGGGGGDATRLET